MVSLTLTISTLLLLWKGWDSLKENNQNREVANAEVQTALKPRCLSKNLTELFQGLIESILKLVSIGVSKSLI